MDTLRLRYVERKVSISQTKSIQLSNEYLFVGKDIKVYCENATLQDINGKRLHSFFGILRLVSSVLGSTLCTPFYILILYIMIERQVCVRVVQRNLSKAVRVQGSERSVCVRFAFGYFFSIFIDPFNNKNPCF